MTKHRKNSRRSFLKQAGIVPFLKYAPLMTGLGTAQAAVCNANTTQSLVCVFLLGGADSFNFVVPRGNAYDDYLATRGSMAVPSNNLINASDPRLGDIGFNDRLPGLHELFQDNQLAVVANVGNLIRPTTKANFNASTSLPESLFAHNAQQKLWQTASGNLSDSFGWGGSIAQNVANCNNSSNIATSISIDGSNNWLSNVQESFISLSPTTNIQRMAGFNSASLQQTLEALIQDARSQQNSPFQQEVANAIGRANSTANNLVDAINDHPVSNLNPDGDLQQQLHLVARLISAREDLNMGKQVFYVGLGGWDTHSNQNVRIEPLLDELNTALTTFQEAIDGMGKGNTVTTFTASDFGRTLTTNGDGTDHGWGGHSLVMGGQVDGGKIYGDFPSFKSQNNPDDAGDNNNFAGRIIPKIAVSQFAATLADWMGVTPLEQAAMLPNLANFSVKNLGFMGP